jgi:hypothetical protein
MNSNPMDERNTAYNSRLASCGVMCLNASDALLLGFSGRLKVKCSDIPHERQAANRYGQVKKNDTIKLKYS